MRGISTHRATVSAPDGTTFQEVSVTAKRGTFLVRQGRGRMAPVVVQLDGVTAVRHVSRNLWELDTPDGLYLVKDLGCGCV